MKKLLTTLALTGALASSMLAEIESSVDSSKESKGFCQGKHSNTGCFVGVSVGFAPATSRLDFQTNGETFIKQPKKESFSFPIAFDLGYQWYFAQNSGFRFKGYIGYENYSAKDMEVVASGGADRLETELASHALQYGLEARYLYDFIYGGAHTFGASIGVGFEGSSFFNTATMLFGGGEASRSNAYTRATWTSGVGLHYFYHSHHQILLSYLYRGYTDELKTITTEDPFLKVSAFANHTIQLSYAYKF
ncbi:outer membrane beta-barrel protein [Helicobacter canis]|uniref:Outer membrane beta-barrel protein n=1 Tax=Helicobacter canis TaxID=29419 RepID=A0A5M9QSW9_9HELI|nr:outer membrane beta-barrel protein [Helicobacter canis]KAA8711480.1 outer membrane beta-barrel protein [Helicobacter canis]